MRNSALDSVKEATSLLQLVWTCCNRSPQILALYLDELVALVSMGRLHKLLEVCGSAVPSFNSVQCVLWSLMLQF